MTVIVWPVAWIMLMASTNPLVQYAGTFLGALGIYATIPLTIAWIANNVEGVYKRGIVLGFVIGWGNINGVVSSNIYFNGPRFFEGYGVIIAYLLVCSLGGTILMMMLLHRENKKREAGERDSWVEGLSAKEVEALGDKRPDFFYIL